MSVDAPKVASLYEHRKKEGKLTKDTPPSTKVLAYIIEAYITKAKRKRILEINPAEAARMDYIVKQANRGKFKESEITSEDLRMVSYYAGIDQNSFYTQWLGDMRSEE